MLTTIILDNRCMVLSFFPVPLVCHLATCVSVPTNSPKLTPTKYNRSFIFVAPFATQVVGTPALNSFASIPTAKMIYG